MRTDSTGGCGTPRGCAVAPMIRPDVADELAIPPGGASSELTAV
ncbi:MAG TPA: hypothetical protein VN959_11140 [Mycobacterium sp.]|nr:hypothetical protein [Mycobacterium sp.]